MLPSASHIAQYKHGVYERLVGQDRRVHADFLAGYFAGRRKLETSDFPAAVFAVTQSNLGDQDFGSPDHHEKGVQYVMEIWTPSLSEILRRS